MVSELIEDNKRVLHFKWAPITTRIANIPLDPTINTTEYRFPSSQHVRSLSTNHKEVRSRKSYNESQHHQLVYGALSRVTSLDSLYMTNT
ncbi:hypothetical protein TNCV_1477891 [Trichonephila clavipes]|nr:hypothetical protein TNCV_1477891 [Trichonephila clavipes]